MAQNYIQRGDVIQVTLGATIASGAGIKVGSLIGVALQSGVSGDTIPVQLEGVFELPKASGAISIGAPLYWDDSAKNLTTTSSSNTAAGFAFAAAASGATTVQIRLERF